MKKWISQTALLAALAASPVTWAGGDGKCHFHGNAPAKEAVVTACANAQKDELTSSGKIEASWKAAKLDKAETVDGKKSKEWKFTYKNTAAKDVAKQTLYMFYALNGNYIGANFTGQ